MTMTAAELLDGYKRGRRDFRGQDLSGEALAGACLIGADFREADLSEADLTGATLFECNFGKATLRGTVLRNCVAGNRPRTRLRVAATLFLLIPLVAFASTVVFLEIKSAWPLILDWMAGACLLGALLFGLHLRSRSDQTLIALGAGAALMAPLGMGTVMGLGMFSQLWPAVPPFALIAVALVAGGTAVGWLSRALLAGDDLFGRDMGRFILCLGGTSFRGAFLAEADFTGASLHGTDFREALLLKTCFARAQHLSAARFDSHGVFRYLRQEGVQHLVTEGKSERWSFQQLRAPGASLRGLDLREAELKQSDLTLVDGRGVNFQDADLEEADLRDANLTGADLRGACLKKTNLEGALVEGAQVDLRTYERSGWEPGRLLDLLNQGLKLDEEQAARLPDQAKELLRCNHRVSPPVLASQEDEEQIAQAHAAMQSARSTDDKGKTLETLMYLLLRTIPGFHDIRRNDRSIGREVDLIIENRSESAPWKDKGPEIAVECKNWLDKRFGLPHLSGLRDTFRRHFKAVFIVSSGGFTYKVWRDMPNNENLLVMPVVSDQIKRMCQPGDRNAILRESHDLGSILSRSQF